jgi:hypothetical protein
LRRLFESDVDCQKHEIIIDHLTMAREMREIPCGKTHWR